MPNRYEVPTDISGKVDKAGDTMAGDLTMAAGADINMAAGRTVDGKDVSVLGNTKIYTGSYTGNGLSSQSLVIGLSMSSFSLWMILLKCIAATDACFCTNSFSSGDSSKLYSGTKMTDGFLHPDAHGFTVGANTIVNSGGDTINYVILYKE